MFPEQGSRMQTPFYVTKRTVVTKETALALFNELLNNDDPTRKNASDLIDFCLSGPKEEKVFLSLGGKVRLKENDGWQHCGPTSGEAVLAAVAIEHGRLILQFDTEDDYNAVHTGNMDLSDYVELV
jgi:hypothetical protein